MTSGTLERLAELNQQLLEVTRLEDGLRLLTDSALRLLPADHASVRLCDDEGRLASAARSGVGVGRPALTFRRGEGVIGWVAETGCLARIDDARREPRFAMRGDRGFGVASVLSAPMLRAGRVLGVLSLSAPQPHAFGKTHEALAQCLAAAAAQLLRQAELAREAMIDPQTLAYNRRCLFPRLREEMERALRNHDGLSLLLIDLDHFKRVNDAHGHAVGDQVLRACADIVRECVRSSDVLVRRGGEEFVLIMPATDHRPALRVARRVREHLASRPLPLAAGVEVTQTASIGVATWDGVESPETLEERADLAMYRAKRQGRNRVASAAARKQRALSLARIVHESVR